MMANEPVKIRQGRKIVEVVSSRDIEGDRDPSPPA